MKKWLLSCLGYTLCAVFVLLVCAVPVVGCYELGKTLWYLTQYEDQTGTVVGYKSKHFKQGTKYACVVKTADGTRITARWYGSKDWCERQQGKQVSVLINPEKPQEGVVNSLMDRWLLPAVLLGLTSLLVVGYLKKRKTGLVQTGGT
ncbi:DUF3592 domain-containing protein [Gimesia sp.]|uniref:DUF3592 domain-containing protein n=1 Tax=Gimesia sp. TaxID=2024833 RepID=UPI003A948BFE